MSYTIKLFKSSGFSKENIPDSPELLNSLEYLEIPSLNLIQDRFLSEVSLRVNYEDVKNCDYCQVGSTYYFITNILSTSKDICKIFLTMDCLTTSGGIINLDFLDGVTERHHTGQEEKFGKYTEDDPLLSCTEPLQIVGYTEFIPDSQGNTYIESTVDLKTMGQQTESTTYEDPNTGLKVTVPSTVPAPHPTKYGITKPSDPQSQKIEFPIINGTCTYISGNQTIEGEIIENEYVKNGVKRCRDLGIESSILNQYTVPAAFMGGLEGTTESPDLVSLSGVFKDSSIEPNSDYNFIYDENVKNLRILYGLSNQYEILCPNGNSGLYKPEDIYNEEKEETIYPHIWLFSDVRAEGSPFYRFKYLNKSGVEDGKNCEVLLNGCIKGSNWTSVPLTFYQKSGNRLDLYNFNSELNSFNVEKAQQNIANDIGLFTSGFNLITAPLSLGGYQEAPSPSGMGPMPANRSSSKAYGASMDNLNSFANTAGGIGGAIGNFAQSAVNSQFIPYLQENKLHKMYMNFGFSQNVIVPQIMFPFQSATLRDILKNGFVTFRYRPSDNDLQKQDKLLTMFGYRHTDIFKKEYLTNRTKFNYIKCFNLSISSSIPQWLKEGCLAQIEGGIRVWHVLPDEQHYNDNPVKIEGGN